MKSFLSSSKERHKWHKGIYKGLKIHDPRTLYSELKQIQDFKKWEKTEGHYRDLTMTIVYFLKYGGYGIGLTLLPKIQAALTGVLV